jgi:hypothetical protein
MGEKNDGNSCRVVVWPKAAYDLVRANKEASGEELQALISRLQTEYGKPRWACWRFVRRRGIEFKRQQRKWTQAERDKLVNLIADNHSVRHVAGVLRRSSHSVWHMLRRLGISTKMSKDGFTKYQLSRALYVRPERIQSWADRGWLKIGDDGTINAEDFCNFCKKHAKDVVGERLKVERLEFVRLYVFPPRHAESLAVRESKKERAAYEEQALAQAERAGKPPGSEDAEDGDDGLQVIA